MGTFRLHLNHDYKPVLLEVGLYTRASLSFHKEGNRYIDILALVAKDEPLCLAFSVKGAFMQYGFIEEHLVAVPGEEALLRLRKLRKIKVCAVLDCSFEHGRSDPTHRRCSLRVDCDILDDKRH